MILRSEISSAVYNFTAKFNQQISLPQQANLRELITGMIVSGSSQLSKVGNITAAQNNARKNTERFARTLNKIDAEQLQQRHVTCVANVFRNEPVLLLTDDGDFQKPHAHKMEKVSACVDGSNGHKVGKGYATVATIAYGVNSGQQMPVTHHLYSYQEDNFKSRWEEEKTTLGWFSDWTSSAYDRIVVEDRGCDDVKRFVHFRQTLSLSFLTRLKTDGKARHLQAIGTHGELRDKRSVLDLAIKLKDNQLSHLPRDSRTKRQWHNKKRKQNIESEIFWQEVRLPDYPDMPLWLLVLWSDAYKQPMVFLTDIAIKDVTQAWSVFFWYTKRWEVENFFRGVKQHFHAEGFLIRNLKAIKTLAVVQMLAYGLLIKLAAKIKDFLGVMFACFTEFCRKRQRSKQSHHDLLAFLRHYLPVELAINSYRSCSRQQRQHGLPPDRDQLRLFFVGGKW